MKMCNLVQGTRAISRVAVGYTYGSGSLNIASMYGGYRERCTVNVKETAILIPRLFNPRKTSMVSVSLSRI